jgi:hypothetical protein
MDDLSMNPETSLPPERPSRALVVSPSTIEPIRARRRIFEALKALRDEGARTLLMNARMTTIAEWSAYADAAYFLPLEPRFMKRVIVEERVDTLLVAAHDEIAIACVRELEASGFRERHPFTVFGVDGGGTIRDLDTARPIASAGRIRRRFGRTMGAHAARC